MFCLPHWLNQILEVDQEHVVLGENELHILLYHMSHKSLMDKIWHSTNKNTNVLGDLKYVSLNKDDFSDNNFVYYYLHKSLSLYGSKTLSCRCSHTLKSHSVPARLTEWAVMSYGCASGCHGDSNSGNQMMLFPLIESSIWNRFLRELEQKHFRKSFFRISCKEKYQQIASQKALPSAHDWLALIRMNPRIQVRKNN